MTMPTTASDVITRRRTFIPYSPISNPRPEILAGGAVAAAFFFGFVGWSSFAPLDAAAHATGQVAVSGHRQAIQHRDGGVVSNILVHEGDRVVAGQPLLELNSTEAREIARSLASRTIQRQAEIARLKAEMAGGAIVAPAAFAQYEGEDAASAVEALRLAGDELTARRTAFAQAQASLRSRVTQIGQQIGGGRELAAANSRQQILVQNQLDGMRRLADQGYAPRTRVQALESELTELQGGSGSQRAEIARLSSSIGEVDAQLARGVAERQQSMAEELRDAETDLAVLLPQWAVARQQLAATQLRAPVAGVVMAQVVNNTGAVVGPGQVLLEIVPTNDITTLDVRFSPRDIENLTVGQPIDVRFSSLSGRRVPVVQGSLSRLAPDATLDERTGAFYYTASVRLAAPELDRLGSAKSEIRSGLPVEIMATKRKRTMLQSMLEPLLTTLWRHGG